MPIGPWDHLLNKRSRCDREVTVVADGRRQLVSHRDQRWLLGQRDGLIK